MNPSPPQPTVALVTAESRPRVWTVFLAAFAVVPLAMLTLMVAVDLVVRAVLGGPREDKAAALAAFAKSSTGIAIAGAVGSIAILGTALSLARGSSVGVVRRLALGPSRLTPREPAVGVLGVLAAGGCVRRAIDLFAALTRWSAVAADAQAMRTAVPAPENGVWRSLVYVALLAMIAPIAEETFFRGYVQTRLCARWGRAVGVGVASIMFGLYHLPHPMGTTFMPITPPHREARTSGGISRS